MIIDEKDPHSHLLLLILGGSTTLTHGPLAGRPHFIGTTTAIASVVIRTIESTQASRASSAPPINQSRELASAGPSHPDTERDASNALAANRTGLAQRHPSHARHPNTRDRVVNPKFRRCNTNDSS